MAFAVLLAAVLVWQLLRPVESQRDRTGLFTTLPILWAESPDLAGMLKPDAAEHWAKAVIASGGEIVPLDTLDAPALNTLKYLMLAQPRPLSPQENVALDDWVRGGGKLLLLADPMLTEDSAFAIGDKRRRQDVVELSPILKRWGLRLEFASEGEFAESPHEVMGMQVPVKLPGRLLIADPAHCRAWGEGLAATCAIGTGRVFVLADAAVLERDDPQGARRAALQLLLDSAFTGR